MFENIKEKLMLNEDLNYAMETTKIGYEMDPIDEVLNDLNEELMLESLDDFLLEDNTELLDEDATRVGLNVSKARKLGRNFVKYRERNRSAKAEFRYFTKSDIRSCNTRRRLLKILALPLDGGSISLLDSFMRRIEGVHNNGIATMFIDDNKVKKIFFTTTELTVEEWKKEFNNGVTTKGKLDEEYLYEEEGDDFMFEELDIELYEEELEEDENFDIELYEEEDLELDEEELDKEELDEDLDIELYDEGCKEEDDDEDDLDELDEELYDDLIEAFEVEDDFEDLDEEIYEDFYDEDLDLSDDFLEELEDDLDEEEDLEEEIELYDENEDLTYDVDSVDDFFKF